MIVISIRLTILMCLNYFVFYGSKYLDVYQLIDDIRYFVEIDPENQSIPYFIISLSVSLLTLVTIQIFRPFIEIYLLHYTKYFFYFLVSLISISSIFIIYRIYGYSRLSLLVYLIFSSLALFFSERLVNKLI
jgi:magnesium-transporting ATPase (P-type)